VFERKLLKFLGEQLHYADLKECYLFAKIFYSMLTVPRNITFMGKRGVLTSVSCGQSAISG